MIGYFLRGAENRTWTKLFKQIKAIYSRIKVIVELRSFNEELKSFKVDESLGNKAKLMKSLANGRLQGAAFGFLSFISCLGP